MTGLLLHAQRALAVATTSSSSIGDQLQHLNLQVTPQSSHFSSQHTKHTTWKSLIYISMHEVDIHLCMHTAMHVSCKQLYTVMQAHTYVYLMYTAYQHVSPIHSACAYRPTKPI